MPDGQDAQGSTLPCLSVYAKGLCSLCSLKPPPLMHQLLRASGSIIGQNLIWLGMFDLLEGTYPNEPKRFGSYAGEVYGVNTSLTGDRPTAWRELCFVVTGLYLFSKTNSLVANSWVSACFAAAAAAKPPVAVAAVAWLSAA